MDSISITGFAWRIAFALALVFATFNPSGFSYFHWVSGTFPSFTPARSCSASPCSFSGYSSGDR